MFSAGYVAILYLLQSEWFLNKFCGIWNSNMLYSLNKSEH